MKQTESLYARSNMIIRKFASASLNTKIMLFNAYCTPIMAVRSGARCISIPIVNWMLQIMMPLDTCCMNLHYYSSASQLLVANNVSSFTANIRKLVYSLWRSLNASDNVLVNTTLRSDLLVRSPVCRKWRNILFWLLIFTVGVHFSIVFYCMGFEPAIECEWNEMKCASGWSLSIWLFGPTCAVDRYGW